MHWTSRIKIVHQLSLLLTSAALLAVLAMSAVIGWNLRAGFSDYLAARDTPQLERLATLIANRSVHDPDLSWLRGSREGMESLLYEFRGFERGFRPPPPDTIEGWVQIFDDHGDWLAGRPQPGKPSRTWPVILQNKTIAHIQLYRAEQPTGVDGAFLQRQYIGLASAGFVILLFSLFAAWLVAKRWAKPLRDLQEASKRIAAGDLSQRTVPTGALEIAQLMTDVNNMSEALDRLHKARRLWIAQISHELRTPLSVLRGELEAIQDGARQASPSIIKSLLDEVLQLTRLVGDLHLLSMADIGQLSCEFETQNVTADLRRITTRYEVLSRSHGLNMTLQSAADVVAHWDMRRIQQVLSNLFENSLRYTHSPGRILVQWSISNQTFHFTLEDSAPSVPTEALSQMFEPLYRTDTARSRAVNSDTTGGSGLGLAIVRAIVHAHHGSITATHSNLGGIKIDLLLPLKPHAIS